MYPIFNPRNPMYKSTQKAVPAGEPLRLRLLLQKHTESAWLNIYSDTNGYNNTFTLAAAQEFADRRFFEVEISLEQGLYWYTFGYYQNNIDYTIGKGAHSVGTTDSTTPFQLTVYSADFKTPDWLKGGIIYQIFPDRFFASINNQGDNIPTDRFLQTDWSAQPAHTQTNSACRLNNDYYGGNLSGITQKLDYLSDLGVSCIYLNPIFEAHSNHRYNTADYMKIDSILGDEQSFKNLCCEAKKRNIHIILDGVFSHTGDDSVYFNKYGRYDSVGAYNSSTSPYYSWYKFGDNRDSYSAWWGIKTLPETNESDPSFCEFICGENGVLRHWISLGADGWRLDVADELPDDFLCKIRSAVKAQKSDALIIGEVWEDATNKISYGARRKFLLGDQLDSVMNYPFANAIINFVNGENSRELIDTVLEIVENYPNEALHCLMNHIGTHDTARALTVFGTNGNIPQNRLEQAHFKLSDEQLKSAKRKLRLAAALSYTLPGVPSLYYGDEAGMQGGRDPFCRAAFPWDNADAELTEFYKALGKIRRENPCFINGDFIPLPDSDLGHIAFLRKVKSNALLILVNRWCDSATITLPSEFKKCTALMGSAPNGRLITANGEDIFIGLCE